MSRNLEWGDLKKFVIAMRSVRDDVHRTWGMPPMIVLTTKIGEHYYDFNVTSVDLRSGYVGATNLTTRKYEQINIKGARIW